MTKSRNLAITVIFEKLIFGDAASYKSYLALDFCIKMYVSVINDALFMPCVFGITYCDGEI